jgi:inhibitor of KinA sporulation pathway (predicted exonuclease)
MKKQRSGPVIFDLEFTAWEGSMQHAWTRPGEFREIVQIGAVRLGPGNLRPVDEFELLILPRLNPVLSGFFTELTGITNEDMAKRGVDFVTGYRAFLDFAAGAQLWAHGRDDLVIAANLQLYGWDKHLSVPPYTNAILWFLEQGVDLRGKHACDAPEAAGAVFTGRKHNALDDARGVAAAIRAMIEKGAPNPFAVDAARTKSGT